MYSRTNAKPDDEQYESDIDGAIKLETESIQDYTKLIAECTDAKCKAVYKEILADEKDHLVKLNKIKKDYEGSDEDEEDEDESGPDDEEEED